VKGLLVSVHVLVVLMMPILMIGLVNRTKSLWAGRKGPGLVQFAWDLRRLLRKQPVYSTAITPLFRAGAWVVLASSLLAALIAPILVTWPRSSSVTTSFSLPTRSGWRASF